MKFATSILTAAALLASCVSSIPLNPPDSVQIHTVRTESKTNYDVEKSIEKMFQEKKDDFQAVCTTDGGWESAVQVLLERKFQKEFSISRKTQIREVPVYKENSMKADFVLPDTAKKNGMIIELKCENKNSNYGTQMKAKVQGDINKAKKIKADYKDYKFVVVAMAYSTEAEKTLTDDLHLKIIEGAEVEIEDSDYSSSSQGGSDAASNSDKSDSDTEMKDASDTNLADGSSESSDTNIKIKVYQKEVLD